MTTNSVPRDPSREASDAIRGYVYQFAAVVEALLDDPEAVVYVEAFEDLLVVSGTGLTAHQLRSRAAGFSLTQRPHVEMLDRWVALADSEPATTFALVSTQAPSNLHDGSDSFRRWIDGDHEPGTANEICGSILSYITKTAKRRTLALAHLGPLLDDGLRFRDFFQKIRWRFGHPELSALLDALAARIATERFGDSIVADNALHSWLGRIAVSATYGREIDKRWTRERLRAGDTGSIALLVSQLLTIIDKRREQEFDILLEKLRRHVDELRREDRARIVEHIVDHESSNTVVVGRASLLAAIEDRGVPASSGYVILEAEAGLGKSTIAREFVSRTGAAAYFGSIRNGRTHPGPCLRHLAASIIIRYGLNHDRLPERAGNDSSFLISVLREVSELHSYPVWLVVDALDEADTVPGANPFLLPDSLPSGIWFLCTRRPNSASMAVAPGTFIETLRLRSSDIDQSLAIEAYVRKYCNELITEGLLAQSDYSDAVSSIISASENNFMYVAYVLTDVRARRRLVTCTLPSGLDGYYSEFISQMEMSRSEHGWPEWNNLYGPVLSLLAAAREPVTARWLADIANRSENEITERVLLPWGRFLSNVENGPFSAWQVVHQSFSDYLSNTRKFAATTTHARIVRYYLEDPLRWPAPTDRNYASRHLVEHLARGSCYDDMFRLLDGEPWKHYQLSVDPTGTTSIADLDIASRALEAVSTKLVVESSSSKYLRREVLLALQRAHIFSRASNFPPIAVAELVSLGRWTPTEAIRLCEQNSDPLSVVETLSYLQPVLGAIHVPSALQLVRSIRYPRERARGLGVIARCLRDVERNAVVDEAFDALLTCPAQEVAMALHSFSDLLAGSALRRSMDRSLSIAEKDYGQSAIVLLERCSTNEKLEIISKLTSLSAESTEVEFRIRVDKNLLPYLDKQSQQDCVRRLLSDLATLFPFHRISYHITLLPYLDDDQCKEHIISLRTDIAERDLPLHLEGELAPWYQSDERRDFLSRLAARRPASPLALSSMMTAFLGRKLPEDAFVVAEIYKNPEYMCIAATHVEDGSCKRELLSRIITCIRSGPRRSRSTALSAVLPLLAGEERATVFRELLVTASDTKPWIPAEMIPGFLPFLSIDEVEAASRAAARVAIYNIDVHTLLKLDRYITRAELIQYSRQLLSKLGDNALNAHVAVSHLLKHVGDPAIESVLVFTRQLRYIPEKILCLLEILKCSSAERRPVILDEALRLLPDIPRSWRRHLYRQLGTWTTMPEIIDDPDTSLAGRITALWERLEAHLDAGEHSNGLDLARSFEEPERRMRALLRVADELEEAQLPSVVLELLDAAASIDYMPVMRFERGWTRSMVDPSADVASIARISSRCGAEFLKEVTARLRMLVQRLPNADDQTKCLLVLMEHVPTEQRPALVMDAIRCAVGTEVDLFRAEALHQILPFLSVLTRDERYESFRAYLSSVSRCDVTGFFRCLPAMLPLLEEFGGRESCADLYQNLRDRYLFTPEPDLDEGNGNETHSDTPRWLILRD